MKHFSNLGTKCFPDTIKSNTIQRSIIYYNNGSFWPLRPFLFCSIFLCWNLKHVVFINTSGPSPPSGMHVKRPSCLSLSPSQTSSGCLRWPAPCPPTPCPRTPRPGTPPPAETPLSRGGWALASPSSSTAAGRSLASHCGPSGCTPATETSTPSTTWSGYGRL